MEKSQSLNQSLRKSVTSTLTALAIALGQHAVAGNFKEVWTTTKKGSYSKLPSHPTTNASFFSNGINILANSAARTLSDESDILPHFQKLVHPIGICFAGTWKIEEASPYSGYFAKNANGLIIVRASEALGQPLQGRLRSFGIAGKLFPTTDKDDGRDYKTANFFTVDDLGGTMAESFFSLAKSNEPATSFHLSTVLSLPMFGTIINTFKKADTNPGVRQLYPIAELDLADPNQAVAPRSFVITSDINPRGDLPSDFRDELRLHRFPGQKLTFGINIAEGKALPHKRIGSIILTEEALSEGCDHRLHFRHPRWRN